MAIPLARRVPGNLGSGHPGGLLPDRRQRVREPVGQITQRSHLHIIPLMGVCARTGAEPVERQEEQEGVLARLVQQVPVEYGAAGGSRWAVIDTP